MTRDELNKLPHDRLVNMFLQMSESNAAMQRQIASLQESVAVLTQQRFGRKTEKRAAFPGQMEFNFDSDGNPFIFNEAEALADDASAEEPEIETVVIHHRKHKGKREADLSGLETVVEETVTIPDDRLEELFPKGYHRLPDEVYKDLEYVPARCIVHEHHIAVYAGNGDAGVVRADKPERLLKNSILTPSLAAGIFEEKYINQNPFNRIEADFHHKDINISRQVMAGWMITLHDRYLRPLGHAMHREILKSRLIHCDETPFRIPGQGRGPNAKNYMWVYHTGEAYGSPPIYIYDYCPTRKADHPRKFLSGYKGILMTDGYQAYHRLARETPEDLQVAGCWTHAKRKFSDIVKSAGSKGSKGTIAEEAVKRISAIYHMDNKCKKSSEKERLENRQTSVKPLVDEYFAWLKSFQGRPDIDQSSPTAKAINYSLNQEPYLRLFLTDPIIPLDNNDAERSIRNFCIGKKNFQIIDSKNGAEASAQMYSIAETAKANGLKPFEYFRFVLEQMLAHQDDSPSTYIDSLLPWSEQIPDYCREQKQNNTAK